MRSVGIRHSGKSDPHVEVMYKVDELDQALAEGDFIINILPLTDETKGLYNAGRFEAMNDGTFFVNVGRGPSVDTDALLAALRWGKLFGAGLDMY